MPFTTTPFLICYSLIIHSPIDKQQQAKETFFIYIFYISLSLPELKLFFQVFFAYTLTSLSFFLSLTHSFAISPRAHFLMWIFINVRERGERKKMLQQRPIFIEISWMSRLQNWYTPEGTNAYARNYFFFGGIIMSLLLLRAYLT